MIIYIISMGLNNGCTVLNLLATGAIVSCFSTVLLFNEVVTAKTLQRRHATLMLNS